MNPMPTLPTLKDGDVVVHESCAINLHLARMHPGGNLPTLSDKEMCEATQWSFWAMWNIERHGTDILLHRMMLPEAQRDPKAVERTVLIDADEIDDAEAFLEAGAEHLILATHTSDGRPYDLAPLERLLAAAG